MDGQVFDCVTKPPQAFDYSPVCSTFKFGGPALLRLQVLIKHPMRTDQSDGCCAARFKLGVIACGGRCSIGEACTTVPTIKAADHISHQQLRPHTFCSFSRILRLE
jgi:hypothetical protein